MTNTEVEQFLAHHGVAGMHWGKRKAQVVSGVRSIGAHYSNKASAQLAKDNGKKGLSVTKAVGKNVASGILINAGSVVIRKTALTALDIATQRKYHSAINKGSAAANVILQVANTANGVGNVVALAKAKRAAES